MKGPHPVNIIYTDEGAAPMITDEGAAPMITDEGAAPSLMLAPDHQNIQGAHEQSQH